MTHAGKMLGGAVIAVMLAMGFSGAAAAKSLADSKAVNSGLISVGIALEIAEKCPDISTRTIKGYGFLNALKRQARSEGFSDDEIDAYVDDKAQKERLIGKARAYMRSKGADGSAASYCKLGREEIAAGTQAGGLMRAK
ncbi:DUF5333 domain-containing protein [Oceanicola sp. 502str15]|uniref:DUF5333 domain-containing protein n=1 Tax=Oceanicola sp. 502str15 TaxID=2696061 RepID=UPI0020965547|nr:DUF5333 domain-containing protein [Oceanicola sp. 502str15]MCO6382475.1 hypothetical protein [Oceanicola sp. 502str15]